MDYRQIRELLEWIEKSAFTSTSVSVGGVHVSASKQQMPEGYYPGHMGYAMPMPQGTSAWTATDAPAGHAAAVTTSTPKYADPDETTKKEAAGHIITSPIVGTFYNSSSPETPPFAPIGKSVKKGDVLCILEAMKIMNEITADIDGTVAQVFVENGEMIEARQSLFRIE